MSVIISIMKKFWKNVEKSDNKRLATQSEPAEVEQICNIPYFDDGEKLHLFDVYYPKGTTEKLPVIIDIHGGGWMYGTKELNKIYNLNLAKRGYTVFNISYRLVPDVTVNEQIKDVMFALKFISEHLKDYPCDENNIMLTGDSAGGMLAAFCSALSSNGKLRSVFDVPNPNINFTALLLTSPVPFMKEKGPQGIYTKAVWGKDYKKKPTFNYMNLDEIAKETDFPPTCLITSSGDVLALAQTRKAETLLKSKGTKTLLLDYPKYDGKDLPHVFSVLEPESKAGNEAIDKALNFFTECINEKRKESTIVH